MIKDANGNELTIEEAKAYIDAGRPDETSPACFYMDDLGQILLVDFPHKADGQTPIYFMFNPDDPEAIFIGFKPFTLEQAQQALKNFMGHDYD